MVFTSRRSLLDPFLGSPLWCFAGFCTFLSVGPV